MTFMVIERFHPGRVRELYERFAEKGRFLPKGVKYINSWIDEKIEICYQIMESESRENLMQWAANWNDLSDFEIIPVISSDEAKAKVFAE